MVQSMAVMDEFKEEREALKNGTFKQKATYFWGYYKWHVIIGILSIIIAYTFIHGIITKKDSAFYGAFINSWAQEGSEEYLNNFAIEDGIDLDEYEVFIDSTLYISEDAMEETSMSSIQKLMVYVAASEIDVLGADTPTFSQYAYTGTCADLRTILTPEQLEEYKPYLYYIDQKIADEKEAAVDAMDDTYVLVYPDPSKPEEMTTPVPVGIFVDSNKPLLDAYVFSEESVVMGIVSNSKHQQTALEFIDYVFGKLEQ